MDTSQVKNMSQMFLNCHSLKKLDLSSFKTKQVKDMSQMFSGCRDLKELNISSFDTSQVTDMQGMFSGCETLEELDLSNFDTTKVKDMTDMFKSSDELKSIKFGDKFVVPNQPRDLKMPEKTWIDIGTGTRDNPKPTVDGINSSELLSKADKGRWIVKPDEEYHGPMTVKINNNLGSDVVVEVPVDIQPEFVGSTFELPVPQKTGYKTAKKTVQVMALKDKLSSKDVVTYTPVKTKVQTQGMVEDFNEEITVYPDLEHAQIFDDNEELTTDKSFIGGKTWLSKKLWVIDGQKYYQAADHEWIKATEVFECEKVDATLKTKDVVITNLVDCRMDMLTNRGLGALSIWKAQNIAYLNHHKYYQINENEFVDAEKVDVVSQ